jgi:hypothetical protein
VATWGVSWRRQATVAAVALAMFCGAGWMSAQRAPAPDTKPLARTLAETGWAAPSTSRGADQAPGGFLGGDTFGVRVGALTVQVEPLLTFFSRSPDRCWTLFSPPELRHFPARQPASLQTEGGWTLLHYTGQEPAVLRFRRPAADRLDIDAITELAQPVYSHLNSYCHLQIAGHRRLSLSFSPCPTAHIEVTAFDYPVGRPERFAYLEADGEFHVVEAHSGEKGPYTDLAHGPMHPGEPLTIVLYDQDQAVARVTLADWSAQAGMQLSPTAGWGVPVNAIEFSLLANPPDSPAGVWINLACTSVGRGWDSIGHAAGAYGNRVRIEPAAPEPPPNNSR